VSVCIALLADVEPWWRVLTAPFQHVAWSDVRGFWLGALAYGRNAVLYFLPLLILLRFVPTRYLRHAIVLSGALFIAYVFGLLYLVLWLLTCLAFFYLAERFVSELARPGIPRWLPSLAAGVIIGGHFLLVLAIGGVRLPPGWDAWLVTRTPWLLPLGARATAWEPGWFAGWPLLKVLLARSHEIGAAYLSMRMVHYFSELKRGTIPASRRTFLNFLAFLCYIPTFIQGPIERYKEFHDQLDTCDQRRAGRDALAAAGRFLLGLVKTLFALLYLEPLLVRWHIAAHTGHVFYHHPEQIESYALLFFAVHLQVLLLYLLFSGYCDLAIGMSRWLGYRVIENFRRPWLARSLTDMWRRWHISLSFILRDYVFFPLTRRRWNNTLNLLLTFLVCGIWHNFSSQYAAWGLLMGLMVAVNHKWSRWMRSLDRHPQRRLSAVRRAWLRLQPLPKLCAWCFTVNVFLMSGWVCLGGWGAPRVAWELIRRPAQWLLHPWGVTLPPLP
jgi:hypothetical protein